MTNRELSPLLNRAADGRYQLPADGWYQIAPMGEYPHGAGGVVQVIDARAVSALSAGALDRRVNILVDYDHFSYQQDKPSEAAGWIEELIGRDTGLWGRIRWTPEGEAAVRSGRYRFVSPVWLARDCEEVADEEGEGGDMGGGATNGKPVGGLGRRVRPLRLDSAGLTNNPNLKGMEPLSNRAAEGIEPPLAADEKEKTNTLTRGVKRKGTMTQVMTELGLGAEAAEEAVVAAVQALKNRASALERANAQLLNSQTESDLDRYQDRIKPEKRQEWKQALLVNRAEMLELLEGIRVPAVAQAGGTSGQGAAEGDDALRLHNRARAGTPRDASMLRLHVTRAGQQRAEVLAYQNRHGCPFDMAWRAVKAEKPELFAASES